MKNSLVYWLISGFFLLWGIAYAGLVTFTVGIATEEHWDKLVQQGRIKAEYAQYIMDIPSWVLVITVIAAATRLLGGIGLVMQRSWALPLYAASLCVVAVVMYRGFFIADVASVIRPSQVWLEIGFMCLSVAAVWFSYVQVANGILR
ncbi:MAG: hypothetical protein WBN23_10125 [Woeseia sp.]